MEKNIFTLIIYQLSLHWFQLRPLKVSHQVTSRPWASCVSVTQACWGQLTVLAAPGWGCSQVSVAAVMIRLSQSRWFPWRRHLSRCPVPTSSSSPAATAAGGSGPDHEADAGQVGQTSLRARRQSTRRPVVVLAGRGALWEDCALHTEGVEKVCV